MRKPECGVDGGGTLRRLVGPFTAACVSVGVAVGSGVFATPGEISRFTSSPWLILFFWIAAGAITLMQSLVTAELATRCPRAGGEYQFLKAAYGDFAAFFFGWAYTIFIVGGGTAVIAAALGDFAVELLSLKAGWSGPIGCLAIITATAINSLGLLAGAFTQNVLTTLKALALIGIGIGALALSHRFTPATYDGDVARPGLAMTFPLFFLILTQTMWAYDGTTDSGKLSEEIQDVRRSLPRGLIAAALLLTAVYFFYNYSLLCAVSPIEMTGRRSVPAFVFEKFMGPPGKTIVLLMSILICFGSLASTGLSCVRVTFALARDGLTFRIFGRMSRGQSPVPALILAGALSCVFVLKRSFTELLGIYYLAAAVLFGLSYLSLILFRSRDRREGRPFPETAYRAPAGPVLASLLILMELAIAGSIVYTDWSSGGGDSLKTVGLLVVLCILYYVWKFLRPPAVGRST